VFVETTYQQAGKLRYKNDKIYILYLLINRFFKKRWVHLGSQNFIEALKTNSSSYDQNKF